MNHCTYVAFNFLLINVCSTCNIASVLLTQGEYDLALDILGSAKRRFPSNTHHSPLWMVYEQQLSFMRALLRGDWAACELAIDNMASVNDLESCYS